VGFEKLDPRILPDMSIKVAFREAQSPGDAPATKAALVPKGAVRQDNGRDVVMIYREGRAERRAVTLGIARDLEVAITAGVSAGEKVIVDWPAGLTDGAKVQE
jgi:hypothetical protein